jgi:hypothetical protein
MDQKDALAMAEGCGELPKMPNNTEKSCSRFADTKNASISFKISFSWRLRMPKRQMSPTVIAPS